MRTLTIGSTTLELRQPLRKVRDKVVGVYAEIVIPTTAISYSDLKELFTDNQHDLVVTEEDGDTTTYSGYAQLDEIREKGGLYTVIQLCTSEAIHLLNEAKKQIEAQQNTITEMSGVITAQDGELKAHAKVITEQSVVIAGQTEELELHKATLIEQKATIDEQAGLIEAQGVTLAEQKATIAEQGEAIADHNSTIAEQNKAIAGQNSTIAEQGNTITTQGKSIEEQKAQVAVLEETSLMQTATLESLLLEVIPIVIAEAVAEALASNSTTPEVAE